MNKLYRKLYSYALIILVTSILLTATVMGLLFHVNQRGVFKEHLIRDAAIIRRELNKTYVTNNGDISQIINELGKEFDWGITYWKDNRIVNYSGRFPMKVKEENLSVLNEEKSPVFIPRVNGPPLVLLYLDKNKPDKGYLVLRFHRNNSETRNRPFFMSALLLILFLALLLIPYSKYVLKPYRKLLTSINKVSQGDFSIINSKGGEFQELTEAFNNMTIKIQEMITQKQRLMADVSHELRSPLTRMRLSLEILSKDPEGRKHYIGKAISEIEELDRLIESLLNFSKLELHTIKMSAGDININDLLLYNVEKNQVLFEHSNLTIDTNIPDEEITVNGDRELLNRAIENLFSNIIKYAPENSVVDISLKKVAGNIIHIIIRDRGEGVKEGGLERIFEPFYRADDSRSRKTGGTGLGLAIAKKIIDSHNGKIWAENSVDGNGLEIHINLIEKRVTTD